MNPSNESRDASWPTVPCVVCREDIRSGAKVCNHCNNVQDWSRHLVRWSAVAGAVLGLGSLVSAAISLAKLVPSDAEIRGVALSCTEDSVELALTNSGGKAGVVRSVDLVIDDKGTRSPTLKLGPKDGAGPNNKRILRPGETSVVVYEFRPAGAPSSFPLSKPFTEKCTYILSIDAVEFVGKRAPLTSKCPCPS